jgi:predicted MFS family arabinose efflux permease
MTETPALRGSEKQILRVTCFGHFMSHVNMLVFPALVLPLTAQLELSVSQVMGLSFWMYLLFGISALPWGVLADRWGGRSLLALFFLGASGCSLAVAWGLDDPARLTLALAALGLFSGIYHPTGLGWISRDVERVSRGMAYNGMAGNLGLATAPLLAGLVNFAWGPAAAYAVVAGLNLVGLVLLLVAPRTNPSASSAADAEDPRRPRLLGFAILLAAMMLGGVAYRGSMVTLPALLELRNCSIYEWITTWQGVEISANVVATSIASLIFLIGMAGQYAGGRVAERWDLRWSYLTFHIVTLPAAFAMAWLADAPLVLVAMVYFFFLLGMQPVENTLVARFAPRRFHHAAYGTKFVLTFGVGALAVRLVQAVEGMLGIGMVFPVLGLVSVVLVGSILLLISQTSRIAA